MNSNIFNINESYIMPKTVRQQNVVALAGGVGGAKLAAGLQAALPPGALTVIVNTGDDFKHWGLYICPDIDTVLYGLAGVNNPQTGWGRAAESWTVLTEMERLGAEDWFRLGDKDIALHLRRSAWLRQSISLTEVTDRLRRMFGVHSHILPMSNDPVRTLVHTDEGILPFQDYFVRRNCEPTFFDLTFVGADSATISPEVKQAITTADLIIICPSNPYLSIDPILAVSHMRKLVRDSPAPVVAVSPIIRGEAVKGPAAKIMQELGVLISPLSIVDYFADLLHGFIMDEQDRVLHEVVVLPVLVTDILMTDLSSKRCLAEKILRFSQLLTRKDQGE